MALRATGRRSVPTARSRSAGRLPSAARRRWAGRLPLARWALAPRRLPVSRTIERAVREILLAIGEDPDRDGLRDTPARVARVCEEQFAGLGQEPESVLTTVFDAGHDEMVLVRDIDFYATCEHHLIPFF